jgi:hypothetical protein
LRKGVVYRRYLVAGAAPSSCVLRNQQLRGAVSRQIASSNWLSVPVQGMVAQMLIKRAASITTSAELCTSQVTAALGGDGAVRVIRDMCVCDHHDDYGNLD